jgi:hypothetical protein
MPGDRWRRSRKWLALRAADLASWLVMLLLFRALGAASGTAVAAVVTIIALRHLALFIALESLWPRSSSP